MSDVDLAGNARLVGIAPDRGAFESNNTGLFLLSVTNTNDSGTGSLRQAMLQAEATPGINAIAFNISGAGCPKTINLLTPLPDITQDLVIDGSTQPGFIGNSLDYGFTGTHCIAVTGSSGASYALIVPSSAAASTRLILDGIALGGFSNVAVALFGGGGHLIRNNQIGVINNSQLPLNAIGLRVVGTVGPSIIGGSGTRSRNVFARSTSSGLQVLSPGHQIIGNYFGTDPAGNVAQPNATGLLIARENNSVSGNRLAGNSSHAIHLSGDSADGVQVEGNVIGIKRSIFCSLFGGSCELGNGGHGVWISGNGTLNFITGNTIAHNGAPAVRVQAGAGNLIRDNRLYGNSGPEIDIGTAGFDPVDEDVVGTPGNSGLNWPRLLSVSGPRLSPTIEGEVQSLPGPYSIDFYATDSCDVEFPSLRTRGTSKLLLGTAEATIAEQSGLANGVATFSFTLAQNPTRLPFVTAVARRGFSFSRPVPNDTSEFGNCLPLPDAGFFFDGFESPQPLP